MNDIDGSPIVILSAIEGRRIYDYLYDLAQMHGLDEVELQIAAKIARALDIEPIGNR
jgi:hypothetical protein